MKFIGAGFEDCRISAYPYYGQKQHWYLGYQRPDLLFVDLDNNQFKNTAALDRALKKTLENMKNKLCCYDAVPTILESGSGGYHIIQPLQAPDLKNIEYTNKDFIRFLEPFLSPKADPNHYHNVSMNNCLLRVPGTINSCSSRISSYSRLSHSYFRFLSLGKIRVSPVLKTEFRFKFLRY
jgi:hypothetical protein